MVILTDPVTVWRSFVLTDLLLIVFSLLCDYHILGIHEAEDAGAYKNDLFYCLVRPQSQVVNVLTKTLL